MVQDGNAYDDSAHDDNVHDDNAYEGLLAAHDDTRWAFGTDFDDPLTGVDTTLPAGTDGADLAAYCLMLGDDALVMCQRLTQLVTRAPELEEEVALANIGLDLLGQARLLLARAAAADPAVVPGLPAGSPVPPEDALAYFRDDMAFRNVRLVELADRDFAHTQVRLWVFTTWRLALFDRLQHGRDNVLTAVAAKGVKELTYARDYAARWVVTLAQGTAESRRRTEQALATVWPYVPELFVSSSVERRLGDVACDPASLREEFDTVRDAVLAAADLEVPAGRTASPVAGRAGREGVHTEALGPLLAELQVVARAHPRGLW